MLPYNAIGEALCYHYFSVAFLGKL